MRIGIYFTPTKDQGGIYQYCTFFLEALSKIPKHTYFIITTSKDVPPEYKKMRNFKIIDMATDIYRISLKLRDSFSKIVSFFAPGLINLLYRLRFFSLITPVYKITMRRYIKVIEGLNLDLIFYLSSSNLSFLSKTPAVVTIHDLMHRVYPSFKEVASGGRWESREYGFRNINKKAFRIFVDSEIGKEDMIKYYDSESNKIVPLPYLSTSYLNSKISSRRAREVCDRLSLPKKFVFFPAKFWPHKNHENLIKAVYILKKKGRLVNLVLTGSKDAEFSTFAKICNLIKRYKIDKQVFYLGYVNNQVISSLYKIALAIVFPTFFGPTNIPILEAWVMGTPVLTSDLRGCRDQLGNAGILVNPHQPLDMADKIWKVYNDSVLRRKLSQKGKEKVKQWTMNDFREVIKGVIDDFKMENNNVN